MNPEQYLVLLAGPQVSDGRPQEFDQLAEDGCFRQVNEQQDEQSVQKPLPSFPSLPLPPRGKRFALPLPSGRQRTNRTWDGFTPSLPWGIRRPGNHTYPIVPGGMTPTRKSIPYISFRIL